MPTGPKPRAALHVVPSATAVSWTTSNAIECASPVHTYRRSLASLQLRNVNVIERRRAMRRKPAGGDAPQYRPPLLHAQGRHHRSSRCSRRAVSLSILAGIRLRGGRHLHVRRCGASQGDRSASARIPPPERYTSQGGDAMNSDQEERLDEPQVLTAGPRRSDRFQECPRVRDRLFGKILVLDGVVQLTEHDNHIYHEMITHVALMAHGSARSAC